MTIACGFEKRNSIEAEIEMEPARDMYTCPSITCMTSLVYNRMYLYGFEGRLGLVDCEKGTSETED